MNASVQLSDQAARDAALDTRQSILVQAPAGSGKTTVLACRYLALLAQAEHPREILALTFTRKAAAELRERIVVALSAAAGGVTTGKIEAPWAERAWQRATQAGWPLLATPTVLCIQTIDSFNMELVARSPVQSRGGASLTPTDEAARWYQRAARSTLDEAFRSDNTADAALLLARVGNRWPRLEALLQEMLQRRAHWLPQWLQAPSVEIAEQVANGLRQLIGTREAQAFATLGPDWLNEGLTHAAVAASTLGSPAPNAENGQSLLLQLAELALTGDGGLRQVLNKNSGFPRDQPAHKQRAMAWIGALGRIPGGVECLNDFRHLPVAELALADRAALEALGRLLRQAAAQLQLLFTTHGVVDFPYVAAAARAALTEQGAPTDLALRFGARLKHILVDEFQDTSYEQWELLRALSADWQRGDGRTLFAVGDPMQSIYRFRDAEVGLYLEARARGLGAVQFKSLQLERNFRSGAGIVEWINQHLGPLFPALDDRWRAAVAYLPATSARPDLHAEVHVHGRIGQDAVSEARQVVQLIKAARAADPRCSVAILLANREHGSDLLPALAAAGLPVRGVRLAALAERPVARDLLALARALLHPGDRIAWLALLRSPACGLILPEIQALGETEHGLAAAPPLLADQLADEARLAMLSPESRLRARRLHAALLPAMTGAERALPLAERVERCWLRLGGPAAAGGAEGLEDAQAMFAHLEQLADVELTAASALAARFAELRSTSTAEDGAIEVMTVHAAKGLEWDVVILPGLGRAPRPAREQLLHWVQMPAGDDSLLLMASMDDVTRGEERTLTRYLKRIEHERARSEQLRLWYVAMTRARLRLHLLGHAKVNARGELKPGARSPLGLLWPGIEEPFKSSLPAASAPAAIAGASTAAPPRFAPGLQRLPAAWSPAGALPSLRAQRMPIRIASGHTAPDYQWVGFAARAAGTVVHAELQRWSTLTSLPAVEAFDGGATDYRDELADLGVAAPELDATAARVRATLRAVLGHREARWLLSSARRAAASELALSGWHDNEIVQARIDRTFIDEAGVRWVIDYKTSSHEGGGREQFIAQELLRYRAQLQRYVTLVAALGPEPVRAALYFPVLGELREVPV